MSLAVLLHRRAWSPTVALAVLVAGLVIVLALRRQQSAASVLPELALCALAALSGPLPRVGGALTVAFLGVLALNSGAPELSAYAALLPILSTSIAGRPWLRILFAVPILALLMVLTVRTLQPGESAADYLVFWIAWMAAPWLLGDAVRALIDGHARRWSDQLEAQRLGIARDLHDTVAHSLSLIVMRAEQSRLKGVTTTDDLDFMATTAHQSINDLRGMLTVLRADARAGVPRESWIVADLDGVLHASVDRLRAAGFQPSLSVEGDLTRLSPSVDEALGKVLHEATTNILRHGAPGTRCGLLVAVEDASVELVVSSVPGRGSRHADQPRLGLVGMRERVLSVGGEFSAGLGAERWITRAIVPLG